MLSILIPVYKYNVVPFIEELQRSAVAAKVPFELRVYDDASGAEWHSFNQEIGELEGVIYRQFENNLGRSAMRNQLARDAKFDNLLFIDGDSGLFSPTYVSDIIKHLDTDQVIVGRTLYREHPPQDQTQYLRWLFGQHRESIAANIRQANPYQSFKTHHFAIKKKHFIDFGFNEQLREYGHEDTLFGFELKNRAIPVLHVDHGLYHEGLEAAEVFIKKTDQAIKNLLLINQEGPIIDTKLWRTYQKLVRLPGIKLCLPVFKLLHKICLNKLQSGKPNLFSLDLYKLSKLFIFSSDFRK